jgi:hypothetical protein
MTTIFYFLEAPSGTSVVEWFRTRKPTPERIVQNAGELYYFSELGPLERQPDGAVNLGVSPLVSVIVPRTTHGSLATMGEVHFLAAGKVLNPIANAFRRWIMRSDTSVAISPSNDAAGYFLEGEIKNITPRVHVLPSGQAELEAGRYFISDADASRDQSALCKRLRLRGVQFG